MTCRPGDLVGIPFPYSNESTRKRRPVLVVTSPDRNGDFMGLAVTSVPTEHSAVRIDERAMKGGYLPKPSWIRVDKIFTLSETLIVRNYGALHTAVIQEVVKHLCDYIGCSDT
jgi:mRNA interferase MazF